MEDDDKIGGLIGQIKTHGTKPPQTIKTTIVARVDSRSTRRPVRSAARLQTRDGPV